MPSYCLSAQAKQSLRDRQGVRVVQEKERVKVGRGEGRVCVFFSIGPSFKSERGDVIHAVFSALTRLIREGRAGI